MRHKKLPSAERKFADEVRTLEQRLFSDQLHDTDPSRMKSDRYSWHYRPSHHIQTGLLTKNDIALLSKTGKRLLSIGAFPAFLEQILVELGVPVENILAADNDPAIKKSSGGMQTAVFDATKTWPALGTFDTILFPESLCMCIETAIKSPKKGARTPKGTAYPKDAQEADVLSIILGQALAALKPDGVIRANGPMSHPNIVKAMSANLRQERIVHELEYQRYFLTVRH